MGSDSTRRGEPTPTDSSAPSFQVENPPPRLIPDHQVLRRIGRGSYGEVWLARNVKLGAYRAVKVVRRKSFQDERPFEREFNGILKFEPISLEELEKRHILQTLEHTDWNKSQAAAILQIERSTLDRKIKLYDLRR